MAGNSSELLRRDARGVMTAAVLPQGDIQLAEGRLRTGSSTSMERLKSLEKQEDRKKERVNLRHHPP